MEVLITGGKFRNQKINSACKHGGFRPTLSKVREAVFNILGNDLEGITFLDAFAGSGVMGFEALSRNAAKVVWIDQDAKACMEIRNNLNRLSVNSSLHQVVTGNFFTVFSSLEIIPDILYLDPPFEHYPDVKIFDLLKTLPVQSLSVLELPTQYALSVPDSLECLKEKKYGNIRLIFLRRV